MVEEEQRTLGESSVTREGCWLKSRFLKYEKEQSLNANLYENVAEEVRLVEDKFWFEKRKVKWWEVFLLQILLMCDILCGSYSFRITFIIHISCGYSFK